MWLKHKRQVHHNNILKTHGGAQVISDFCRVIPSINVKFTCELILKRAQIAFDCTSVTRCKKTVPQI